MADYVVTSDDRIINQSDYQTGIYSNNITAKTTSLAFPNMLNPSSNLVNVLEDDASIVNRTRLLMLTEPTELYGEPNFGVGLKRHLFKYNTPNEKAIIQDRIKDQLRLHEPYCVAENTQFADGLLYTGSDDGISRIQDQNRLKMTMAVYTTYSAKLNVEVNDENGE